jgi:hypothetical protein
MLLTGIFLVERNFKIVKQNMHQVLHYHPFHTDRMIFLAILSSLIGIALLGQAAYSDSKSAVDNKITNSLNKEGTFFVSDAGQSHGGFEFTAEYKTEFNVQKGKGTLTFSLLIGLDDPLTKHTYRVTDLQIRPHRITMSIDGNPVEFILVKNDKIWNHQFDNNYIASWGSDAPKREIKGSISPTIFPGLVDFWYVELRIPKG